MERNETRGRVLVVEDEEDLRSLVELNLQLAGLEVQTVGDGRAALDRVSEDPPDLVLLDVMMPVMDGFRSCASSRRTPPRGTSR